MVPFKIFPCSSCAISKKLCTEVSSKLTRPLHYFPVINYGKMGSTKLFLEI